MAKKANPVSRRSFVGLITGAAAATVVSTPVIAQQARTSQAASNGANTAGNAPAEATNPQGVTDSDSGSNSDCAGRGRGSTTGQTDSDSGSSADPAGNGTTGRSDSDPSDRAGYGRGRGSCAS